MPLSHPSIMEAPIQFPLGYPSTTGLRPSKRRVPFFSPSATSLSTLARRALLLVGPMSGFSEPGPMVSFLGFSDEHDARDGHASLAGRAETGTDEGVDGVLLV